MILTRQEELSSATWNATNSQLFYRSRSVSFSSYLNHNMQKLCLVASSLAICSFSSSLVASAFTSRFVLQHLGRCAVGGERQCSLCSFGSLHTRMPSTLLLSSSLPLSDGSSNVLFHDLMIMDVVLFQRRGSIHNNGEANESSQMLELGAVQENGSVAPLSTWTLESSYTSSVNDMMEFVVDEEDLVPGLTDDDIRVFRVVDGSMIGFGARQVGGGKGVGNPHGEESELVYYIDRRVVEGVYGEEKTTIDVVVNPSLEHLW